MFKSCKAKITHKVLKPGNRRIKKIVVTIFVANIILN